MPRAETLLNKETLFEKSQEELCEKMEMQFWYLGREKVGQWPGMFLYFLFLLHPIILSSKVAIPIELYGVHHPFLPIMYCDSLNWPP